MESLSVLLQAFGRGDPAAEEALAARLHGELRLLAQGQLRDGMGRGSVEPTALAHEAWLRLRAREGLAFDDRRAFFSFAAKAMRSILVDRARAAASLRRGGDRLRVGVHELRAEEPLEVDLLDLEDALGRLALLDPESAQLVELRFYGGLSHPEIAEQTGMSLRQVERRWRFARAWLHSALGERDGV